MTSFGILHVTIKILFDDFLFAAGKYLVGYGKRPLDNSSFGSTYWLIITLFELVKMISYLMRV